MTWGRAVRDINELDQKFSDYVRRKEKQSLMFHQVECDTKTRIDSNHILRNYC